MSNSLLKLYTLTLIIIVDSAELFVFYLFLNFRYYWIFDKLSKILRNKT